MMVGRLLFYWEDNFSGAMLKFGRVFKQILNKNLMKNRILFTVQKSIQNTTWDVSNCLNTLQETITYPTERENWKIIIFKHGLGSKGYVSSNLKSVGKNLGTC